jgi:hypothetical protein
VSRLRGYQAHLAAAPVLASFPGALAQVIHGRVSRHCLAHVRCPVLAVAPPALAQEISHGLHGWLFWHRPLTPNQVLQDHGKAV